jgi:hypothetical protein
MVFQDEVHGRPEVVVNFGVFAGREVTQAEIDRLAQQLLEELESFEIVSEQRHQIDHSMEASVTWSGSQAPRAGGSTSH